MTRTSKLIVKKNPKRATLAWAIMDGDHLLAKLYCSDHRWNIYDDREAARVNVRAYGREYGLRVVRVRITEVKARKGGAG